MHTTGVPRPKFLKQTISIAVFLCHLLIAATTHGQVNTGSLSGLVLDPSGAAVAGTSLSVTSTDTGYTRSGKSLPDGAYSLPDLPIGNYTLTASANGFSRVEPCRCHGMLS